MSAAKWPGYDARCEDCGDTEPNPDCDACWREPWSRNPIAASLTLELPSDRRSQETDSR